jgi:hypothetical protein
MVSTVVLLLCGVVVLVGGLAKLRDTVRAGQAPAPSDRRPDVENLTVVVLLLGFAGERAFYLMRRRSSGDGRALRAEILSFAVGAIGLLVGFTI